MTTHDKGGKGGVMWGDLRQAWWTLVLRGVLAIVFGLLCYFVPGITLATLVLFFGAWLIVDGVFAIAGATLWQTEHVWWALLIRGILGIATGVLTFAAPGVTAVVLLFIIGAWAVASGVLEIVTAIRLRREVTGEWLLALSGVASILFGAFLLSKPGSGALAVVFLIGTYSIFVGVLLVAAGVRVRGALRRVTAHAEAFSKAA